MANAPLVSTPESAAAIAALVEDAPLVPFIATGFKINGKPKDYPNEDGGVVRKIGMATVAIANSGITFVCGIYTETKRVKDAEGTKLQRRTYMSLPSTGKGFPRQVFETDDPHTANGMIEFRNRTAREYHAWAKDLNKGKPQVASIGNADGMVEYEAIVDGAAGGVN